VVAVTGAILVIVVDEVEVLVFVVVTLLVSAGTLVVSIVLSRFDGQALVVNEAITSLSLLERASVYVVVLVVVVLVVLVVFVVAV